MRDIANPLIKSYYDKIKNLYPTYEGEEPDNVEDKIYIVISDVSSSDASTMNSTRASAQIQLTINSWEIKYNNSKSLNEAAGAVLSAIKPDQNSILDLSASNMQMTNLSVTNDRIQNYGKLAGRVYISRQIIFDQQIFIY